MSDLPAKHLAPQSFAPQPHQQHHTRNQTPVKDEPSVLVSLNALFDKKELTAPPHLTKQRLDENTIIKERNRLLQLRISSRLQCIKQALHNSSHMQSITLPQSLPATSSFHFLPPLPVPVTLPLTEQQRIKLQIEEKQIALIKTQNQVRLKILDQLKHFAAVPGDYRHSRRLAKEQHRVNDELEKRLKQQHDKRWRDEQNKFLEAVKVHAQNFKEFHQQRQKILAKVNRAVLAYHVNKEKKKRAEEERLRRERLRALRENDEEEYLALVQHTKNERLTQLLKQTEEYLTQIGARVEHEKERANQFKTTAELEQERRLLEDQKASEMNAQPTADGQAHDSTVISQYKKQKQHYYAFAHRIKEAVTVQPTLLVGGDLKKYQMEGLQWLVSLYNNGLNGILADEMGLGKTIQTIALLTFLFEVKHNRGPFLVIVPLATLSNWQLEFSRWAPSLTVVTYRGSKDARKRLEKNELAHNTDFNVVVTTYEMVLASRFLAKREWQYIVVDEGHRLKNADCKLFRRLAEFRSRHRLLLTGTPLQNKLDELWALLNFLLPVIFHSCDSFADWFSAPFQDRGATQGEAMEMQEEEILLVINRLHQVLRPFLLRREKRDVESQLPQKREFVVRCRLSAWQRVVYSQITNKAVRLMDPTKKKRVSALANSLVQLRKVCNHPFLVHTTLATFTSMDLLRSCGKFELLDRILPKLLHTNHKVLIFSQMTKLLDLLEEYMRWKGFIFCRLDGSTKAEDRADAVREFNREGTQLQVFLLSTRAGGLGLNLQVADTVILYDSDWNPQQDLQAQDRAHRIGQRSEVRVLRFLSTSPIEETMFERASAKLDMDKKIIQAGKFNNSATDEDRQEFLAGLLRARQEGEGLGDDGGEVPDAEMINEMIARSEEEMTLFEAMDQERDALWAQECPRLPRLMTEAELPSWLVATSPQEEPADDLLALGAKRKRSKISYDDNLSDSQLYQLWDRGFLDDDDANPNNNDNDGTTSEHSQKRARLQNAAPKNDTDDDTNTTEPSTPRSTTKKRTSITIPTTATATATTPGGAQESTPSKPSKASKNSGGQNSTGKRGRPPKNKPVGDDPSWYTTARTVVNETLLAKDSEGNCITDLFVQLPPKKLLPDYYVIIKRPMDFRTVQKHLERHTYKSEADFVRDMRLIYQNAQVYNEDESIVFQRSKIIQEVLEDSLRLYFPEFALSDNAQPMDE